MALIVPFLLTRIVVLKPYPDELCVVPLRTFHLVGVKLPMLRALSLTCDAALLTGRTRENAVVPLTNLSAAPTS